MLRANNRRGPARCPATISSLSSWLPIPHGCPCDRRRCRTVLVRAPAALFRHSSRSIRVHIHRERAEFARASFFPLRGELNEKEVGVGGRAREGGRGRKLEALVSSPPSLSHLRQLASTRDIRGSKVCGSRI